MNEILTVKQLAELLQVSTRTVYRLVDEEKIGCIRVGGALRFTPADIDRYIFDNRQPRKGEVKSSERKVSWRA